MNIPENILSNLTEEQKKKVEEAKNPEELLALAKEAGQDLTPEQLEGLAGGWDIKPCPLHGCVYHGI